jgi:GNAT superfamily N-acetyltransferase
VPVFEIRDAVLDDLAALKDVFRRASLSNEGDRPNLLAEPEFLDYSDEWVRRGCTRVATVDDRIIGFATGVPDEARLELEDLFVDPDWMRQGAALALIDDLAIRGRRNGFRRIEVTANPHALGFYERAGFVSDGMTTVRWGTASRMHRDLSL